MAVLSATWQALLITSMMLITIGTFCHPNIVIETKFGPVRGLTQEILNTNGPIKAIDKFLGIPFAASPTGKLRFAPPRPHEGWNSTVYDATYFRSICMQLIDHYYASIRLAWEGFSENNISEDCLYLNVYTPHNASKSSKRFPVLAYIHGGGFFAGTPIQVVTPGEYLPLREIILVTIQYRLGPFGFLSTGDAAAPGNYGMLDQVEALRWIKENIISFGGDPSHITLFGESAGGASVNLHLLSSLSEGLYQRVITESGTDLAPFAFAEKSVVSRSSRKLALRLNCSTKDKREMIECLRQKDAGEIVKFASSGIFYPVVDENFLIDSPINLRKMGKFKKVPLIAGFVSNEGSFLLDNSVKQYNQAMMRREINDIVSRLKYTTDPNLLADAMEFQYTPWPDQTDSSKIRKAIIDLFTDYFVVAPTHASLLFQSNYSSTWLYEFRHRSVFSDKEGWQGVAHGDITAYVFGVPLLNASLPHPYTAVDRNVSDMLVTLYTNFVKFGRVMPYPLFYSIEWRKFTRSDRAYLVIQQNPEMAKNYHPSRIAFWNDYLPKMSSFLFHCEVSNRANDKSSWDVLIAALVAVVWVLSYH